MTINLVVIAAGIFYFDLGTSWNVVDIVVVPNVMPLLSGAVVDTNAAALKDFL